MGWMAAAGFELEGLSVSPPFSASKSRNRQSRLEAQDHKPRETLPLSAVLASSTSFYHVSCCTGSYGVENGCPDCIEGHRRVCCSFLHRHRPGTEQGVLFVGVSGDVCALAQTRGCGFVVRCAPCRRTSRLYICNCFGAQAEINCMPGVDVARLKSCKNTRPSSPIVAQFTQPQVFWSSLDAVIAALRRTFCGPSLSHFCAFVAVAR